MKRRVCCLLLAISIICLPVQQVFAAPLGPAANAEEKEKPHEHKHEHPVPPHEKHEHEHPVPPHEHEHEHPVLPHEHEHEHPVPPHEKEESEKPSEPTVAPTSTPTAAPIATPKPTATPVPTAVPTVAPSEVPEEDVTEAPTEAPTASTLGNEVVKYALQFVGNPYKYGGTSLTNGADCSGFVQSIYAHFDYSLSRTSRDQAKTAGYTDVKLSESELQPGDLIFYANGSGVVYHVAIYIGDGKVVHAANSRKGITVSEYTYMKPYKARRVIE